MDSRFTLFPHFITLVDKLIPSIQLTGSFPLLSPFLERNFPSDTQAKIQFWDTGSLHPVLCSLHPVLFSFSLQYGKTALPIVSLVLIALKETVHLPNMLFYLR